MNQESKRYFATTDRQQDDYAIDKDCCEETNIRKKFQDEHAKNVMELNKNI